MPAQQIFGGWWMIKGNAVERLYRNARVTELYAGTSEMSAPVGRSASSSGARTISAGGSAGWTIADPAPTARRRGAAIRDYR